MYKKAIVLLLAFALFYGCTATQVQNPQQQSGANATSPAYSNSIIYVTNSSAISVIDASNNSVIATIGVTAEPGDMQINSDGKYLYVANPKNNTISVVDTSKNQVIKVVSVGVMPVSIAVSPDGRYIYVLNENLSVRPSGGFEGFSTISVIDSSNYTIAKTMPLTIPDSTLASLRITPNAIDYIEASELATAQNGTELYVEGSYAYYASDSVYTNYLTWVLDTTDGNVIRILNITGSLLNGHSKDYIYLIGLSITKISTKNFTAETIPLKSGYPYSSGLALSPDDQILYSSDFYAGQGHYASAFDIFNISSGSLTSVNLGTAGAIAITPDGKLIYITDSSNGRVIIVNATSHTVAGGIPVGKGLRNIIVKSK